MTIGAGLRVKWQLFRALERLSELRSPGAGHAPGGQDDVPSPALQAGSLWVYVSTIGELNAIEPFLRRVLGALPGTPLVLLTDHPHYRESFLAKYPAARIVAIDHRSATAEELIAAYPPRLLLLAEIPCQLSDAPCRLPFAFVYELRRRGIPACIVNGWLYRQRPSCTLDAIEKWLFDADYLRLMSLVTVQDEATREALIAAGADRERVFVTGNIKFDAIGAGSWDPAAARSPVLLRSIAEQGRPTVVGGCVTNIDEQVLVLDAFLSLRERLPQALLILAPRHTEVAERMRKLRELLRERQLPHVFKSELGDAVLPAGIDCLVLDTMGELKDFYGAGDLAYVGLNHNVLEPLCFGKPVVVTAGWNPVYPSFPVYSHLLARGVITQVAPEALAETWYACLSDPAGRTSRAGDIIGALESLKGAAERDVELLARFGLLEQAGRREATAGPLPGVDTPTLGA